MFGKAVEKNGTQWYWCPKHMKGNGLYVTHKPEDHDKRRGKHTKDTSSSNNKDSKSTNDKKGLTLSDKLKAAMVSQFKISESDATNFWATVCEEGDKDF